MLSTVQLTVLAGAAVIVGLVAASLRVAGVWRPPPRSPRDRGGRLRKRIGRGRQRLVAAGAVALLAMVLVGALAAIQVVGYAQHLSTAEKILRDAQAALGTDPAGWTPDRVATAQELQREAAAESDAGATGINHSVVVKVLRVVPGLGPQARALQDLATAEVAATAAFSDYLEISRAVQVARVSSEPPGARLLTLINASTAPSSRIVDEVAPSLAALKADMDQPLLPPLAGKVRQADDVLTPAIAQARFLSAVGRYGPPALGAGGSRSYLLLLPNPSEIRPAGGFSGAVGTAVLTNGTPTAVDVRNQDDLNAALQKKRFDVPAPLGRYLKFTKNSLELGDAGWDPDFPSTARLSEQMFSAAGGRPVDGTISIDPYGVAALLSVTGPLTVPGYGDFTADDFFSRLNVIVNASSGPGTGKAALAPISKAAVNAVLNAPASDWPRLLAVMQKQAETRHIQAYFHDPELAAATASVRFDGSLMSTTGDYLMLVDANVGATKGDDFAHKNLVVKTEVHPELGVARHEVLISYDMPLLTTDQDRALNPGDGSYRDYLRFLLPAQATVATLEATSDGAPVPSSIDNVTLSHDKLAVATFVRVPAGHRAEVRLVYEVPIGSAPYQLYLQKQAGVPGLPTRLQFSYPGGQSDSHLVMSSDMIVRVTP